MLRQENRIVKNKDFDRAFRLGQSFYGKILGIKATDNGLAIDRLGILVSTKISKKAPVRNRFKRQIREIIRQEMILLRPGKDIVIIVFPLILNKDFQEIQTSIRRGLERLRLYK